MTTPWIEIEERQNLELPVGPGHADYKWQAQFACQVNVLSHQDWVKLKWGFNASALFDEMLERQRLFLESQYEVRHDIGFEPSDYRTIALRLINRPGEGLMVSVLGKIHARTQEEAVRCALSYYEELKSTFPYDYTLLPARSRPEFGQISGWDILDSSNNLVNMVQIKRLEMPIVPDRTAPFIQGLWRSGGRAHEPIWRSLASSSSPLLLNFLLRSTVLYEKDREKLLKCGEEIASIHGPHLNKQTLSARQQWNQKYVERRLAPWARFFYLQIHLVSQNRLSEALSRTVGTSLALNGPGELVPGYQVASPTQNDTQIWLRKLRDLDLILSPSYLPVPRLSEVADADEVFAAIRFPYSPPEDGLPGVHYITTQTV